MRLPVKLLLFVLVAGMFMFTSVGCEDDTTAERIEKQSERIQRDVDREVRRVESEMEKMQDRLEEKLDRELTEEDLEKITREIEANVETSMAKVGEALERIGARIKEDSKVSVVDYKDFKNLLPESVEGLDLVHMNGANKSALGIRFSKLEADYENARDDISMEIAILDLGTMKGLTAMGFDWMDSEISNEDLDGFERTTKFGGYPGFESAQYRGSNIKTQGVAIVEDRFVVAINIEGDNLDKDLMDKVFDEFSFRKLRRMAE